MEYPTRQEYDTAVEHLDTFVLVPHLKGGTPKRMNNNRLYAYSGGYSRVYPIEVGNKTIALRCWIADIGKAKERYRKIKSYLQANSLPYFVPFDYFDEGILVNGKKYPVITMEWVNGQPLNGFLDEHIHDSTLVQQLAKKFELMVQNLHHKNISHGDLQEGNILVQKRGNQVDLKLIDYDSLFVPSLQGWQNEIMGLPAYQHPNRSQLRLASKKTDYFSELVIYLSLRAYAEKPNFWKKGQQDQQLLFSVADFTNPSYSAVFRKLKSCSGEVRHLTEQLEDFCGRQDLNQLLPLEKVTPNKKIKIEDQGLVSGKKNGTTDRDSEKDVDFTHPEAFQKYFESQSKKDDQNISQKPKPKKPSRKRSSTGSGTRVKGQVGQKPGRKRSSTGSGTRVKGQVGQKPRSQIQIHRTPRGNKETGDSPIPVSWLGRLPYAAVTLIYPLLLILFLINNSVTPQEQSDTLSRAYAQIMLNGTVSQLFYPFLLYSVISTLLLFKDSARFSKKPLVRLGVYSSAILSLQYGALLLTLVTDNMLSAVFSVIALSAVSYLIPIAVKRSYVKATNKYGLKKTWRGIALLVVCVCFSPFLLSDEPEVVLFIIISFAISLLFVPAPFWWVAMTALMSHRLLKSNELATRRWPSSLELIVWLVIYFGAWWGAISRVLEIYESLPTE